MLYFFHYNHAKSICLVNSGNFLFVRNFIFAVEYSLQVAKRYLIDVIKITIKLNAILALTRLIFLPKYKLNWIQFIKIGFKFKIP